jgi:hypothetical protein
MHIKTLIMKNIFRILSLIALFSIGSFYSSAQIVKIRPNRPAVIIKKPGKANQGHTWVNGHWKWKNGNYVWVKGHWKKNNPGHQWIPGHWNKVKGGHQWIPGHWKVVTSKKRKRRRARRK